MGERAGRARVRQALPGREGGPRRRSSRGSGGSRPSASSTSRPPGGAIFCPNHTSVIDSFFLPARPAPAHHLRGQGRVHGLVEDEVPLPGHGHDPDRPQRRQRGRAGAQHRGPGASSRASSSGSTPRAPGPATAGCTAGTPAPARLALRTGAPIIPVGHRSAPATSSRPTPSCRGRSSRPRCASAARSTCGRYVDRADDRHGAPPDHRRGDVRDPRAHRPGVRRRVRLRRRPRHSRPPRPPTWSSSTATGTDGHGAGDEAAAPPLERRRPAAPA